MKTLYIIRHAKSSWADPFQDDHKRPLNDRGKRDAPYMAELLKAKEVTPDLLVSSFAKRARATAKCFRQVFDLQKSDLIIDDRLYHATPSGIFEVVKDLPDDHDIIAIFGHNPGITDFVNKFSERHIDNVPTTGVAKLRCDTISWKDVNPTTSSLSAFYYPKMFVS